MIYVIKNILVLFLNKDQYPYCANCCLILATSPAFADFLTLPDFYILFLCQFNALSLRFVSRLSTSSCFPHPTWDDKSPKLQNLRKDASLTHLIASGTYCFLVVSYGAGIPSKTLSFPKAAAPLAVLCGSIPLTVLQKILDGAR